MKRYFIACLFVLVAVVAGCSSNSDFADNGTLAATAGSTTLTPGGGTTVSAKYTITTNAQIALAGNNVTFSSSRPDLIAFNPATVQSDSTGAAQTGLTVVSTVQVPTGGVDVVVTASFRGLSSNVIIHVNPGTAAVGTSISLTTPSSANLGSSFAVTAAVTPVTAGKTLTFSSSRADLISFSSQTNVTDGNGSAVTVVSVNPAATIPAAGVDVAFSVTDGTVSTPKIVHISSSATASNAITLTIPASASLGGSFAASAVVSPVAAGDTITFSSNSSAISFAPVSATTNGSGTAKVVATVDSTGVPQNGLDVTVTATDGTISDLQVVHIDGATPAAFSIFPASLDISNVTTGTPTIQIVPPATETPPYNFSAASRAPFIIDVQSVNKTTGVITLNAVSNFSCDSNHPTHTGTVTIEIKDNAPSNTGPTLYYPVTYSLCW